jgi:hypothetical protein
LRWLPTPEKIALWHLLNKDLDRSAIAQRFSMTLNSIRETYAHLREEEAMADIIKATRQVRRARHAKSRS